MDRSMSGPALPEAFLKQMREQLGKAYPAFLRALEAPPALALRLNPARAGARAAAEPFVEGSVPWAKDGYYLKAAEETRPGTSVAHAQGAFYLQEASAMAAATVLDAAPGERVLDLCAAPGGKSTQIAAALAGKGLLVSNDPELSRARILSGNLERMGAANALVVSETPDTLAARWPAFFDAVLVDAPCSGEGMFRRDPAAREQWEETSPAGCARRQARILDAAAELVRPGGRLVYSTCTFNAVENEGSVRAFLERHPDFAPEDFSLPGVDPSREGMLRLWPHELRGDGHFAARLRRAGSASSPVGHGAAPSKGHPEILRGLSTLREAVCALPEDLADLCFSIQGDRLYGLPRCAPPTVRLRVVRGGLCLLRLGRSHIEPDHALAMALPPECAHRRVETDAAQVLAWLRGEALTIEAPPGWTLVMHRGMPLGWGKVVQGWLKNHLPKGLRRH